MPVCGESRDEVGGSGGERESKSTPSARNGKRRRENGGIERRK